MGQHRLNKTAVAVARGEDVCGRCGAPLGFPRLAPKTAEMVLQLHARWGGSPRPSYCPEDTKCARRHEADLARLRAEANMPGRRRARATMAMVLGLVAGL